MLAHGEQHRSKCSWDCPFSLAAGRCTCLQGSGTRVTYFSGCESPGNTSLEYRSPAGKYTVQLRGRTDNPKNIWTDAVLRARAFRGNALIMAYREVHRADRLDDSFAEAYDGVSWPAENVVRIRTRVYRTSTRSTEDDYLRIDNESGRVVQFLDIRAEDRFFVFDLAA